MSRGTQGPRFKVTMTYREGCWAFNVFVCLFLEQWHMMNKDIVKRMEKVMIYG